jgi:hypothetical protein
MGRVFSFRNYGVSVYDETGSCHHLPHAHVNHRGRRVASVFLLSMEFFYVREELPRELLTMVRAEQASLLAKWVELNGDG